MQHLLNEARIPSNLNPKFLKNVMVVPTGTLFKDKYFSGFLSHSEYDFEEHILKNSMFIKRWFADEDPESREYFKQPIGYLVVVNSGLKKVFVYKRAEQDTHYTEKRLQGKYSIGLGGHIEEHDFGKGNALFSSSKRELDEEVKIYGNVLSIRPIGYINDDSNDVGKVHFGILYIVDVDAEKVEPADNEAMFGKMMSIDEIESIIKNPECSMESWSEIALGPLKEELK